MADCTGLENRRTARYREFESLPLRLVSNVVSESQQDAIGCSSNDGVLSFLVGWARLLFGRLSDNVVLPVTTQYMISMGYASDFSNSASIRDHAFSAWSRLCTFVSGGHQPCPAG